MDKILKNINIDLDLASKIKITPSTENVDTSYKSDANYFDNITYCILENNDLEAQVSNIDLIMFIKQKIINICNDIDTDQLHEFKLHKSIKPLKIQQGLQLSDNNKNMLSTLIYLREYYKTNFIIVSDNIIYDDTVKKYNIQYILYQNDKFKMIDSVTDEIIKYETFPLLEKDIKGNIYNTTLKSFTTYKLPDLIKIATDNGLSADGKKKELYERIYIELVNL